MAGYSPYVAKGLGNRRAAQNPTTNSPLGGMRSWWAHLTFTPPINIGLTIP